jgi:hypothetical protein
VIWSGGGDLVLSARRQPVARRRDRDRHLRLCRADRRATRRAHHQGEAAAPTSRTRRGEGGLREAEDRHLHSRRTHPPCRAFKGRRIVVFSGGEAKDLDGVFAEVRAIRDGGANGSIIGRNTFQRPKEEALAMLDKIIKIYQGKD